jgi:LysR family cys regulon transcriptional activator
MKLQQFRYITAMLRHNLNVSETAEALYTSQPGVSKQIRQLEDELGVEIFERNGKQIVSLTPAGVEVVELAQQALNIVEGIRAVAREHADPNYGDLRLATTHTQARYVLPPIIEQFRELYPRVNLQLHQGTPAQIAEMLEEGAVDFGIATESPELFANMVMLPCYHWQRAVLVPRGHALQKIHNLDGLSLQALANYPIITYVFGFTGQSDLDAAFAHLGLKPKVVLTASDADVIKTYVRLGLGVGIVAGLAYQPAEDEDLVALDASALFAHSTTHIGFQTNRRLRGYMYDFIRLFAPHLNRELVDQACACANPAERERLFAPLTLPVC